MGLEFKFKRNAINKEGVLGIRFDVCGDNELSMNINAEYPEKLFGQVPLRVTFDAMCYNVDLIRFLDNIENLIKNYDGIAKFRNRMGDTEIDLDLIDKGLGAIEVSARHIHHIFDGTAADGDLRSHRKIKIDVVGFWTEQSFLPQYAGEIKEFLRSNNILRSG